MYSKLAKMVSELPYNKDVTIRIAAQEAYNKATSGEPISVQEAFHIKQTLFPSVPFEELFEQDREGQPQLTEAETIKVIKGCPCWGEVYPALHGTVYRYVSNKIHALHHDPGSMAAVSYALLVGRAQGIREERARRRAEVLPDETPTDAGAQRVLIALINSEMADVAKPKTLDAILSYVRIVKQREGRE